MMYVVFTFLALLLVPLSNLIGAKSISLGYESTSSFSGRWDAPAFNWVFRILTPSVYIVVVSAVFWLIGIPEYTESIYLITVFYVILRVVITAVRLT